MSKCNEWKYNPTVNPYTNRYIKKNGKVYHKLEAACGPATSDIKPSLNCLEWHSKPSVNPTTHKTIKKYGPAYRKLEKKCGSPTVTTRSPNRGRSRGRSPNRGRSPSRSPSRGRSPSRSRSPSPNRGRPSPNRGRSPNRGHSPSPNRGRGPNRGKPSLECMEWTGEPKVNYMLHKCFKVVKN